MRNLARIYDRLIKKTINEFGKDITIYYTSNSRPYAGSYDTVNNEPVAFSYSTSLVSSTWCMKAITKAFIGSMNFYDYSLSKHGYVPDADLRLTCWFTDALVNEDSANGKTYFDLSKKIRVDNRYYTMKKMFKAGVDENSVLIVTLDEIKNYDEL